MILVRVPMTQNNGSGHNICMKLFVPNAFVPNGKWNSFEKWKSYAKCTTILTLMYITDGKR